VICRDGNNRKLQGDHDASPPVDCAVDEDVRKRFHDVENYVHRLEARVLVNEIAIKDMTHDLERTASMQQFAALTEAIELKLELVRNDIAPLKRAMYWLLVAVIGAVIAAMMRGVLK
jgi:hypothetical protein